MKSAISSVLLLCASLLLPALAQASGENKELVQALSQYVVVLNRPIFVYNWFNGSGRNNRWTTQMAVNDSIGYDHVQGMASKHFQALCTQQSGIDAPDCTTESIANGAGNVFGPGLYASTDPVATAGYGGQDWVLLQIRLQKGFRLANLVWKTQQDLMSKSAQQQLSDLNCSLDANASSASDVLTRMLRSYYSAGGHNSVTDPKCAAGIRHILKDQLKIDGFYYSYDASTLNACDHDVADGNGPGSKVNGNDLRQGAFVITSASHIQPSDIEVFNAQTTDGIADRVRITTVFYKANGVDPQLASPAAKATEAYYRANEIPDKPGFTMSGWAANGCYVIEGVNSCGDWFQICDQVGGTGCTYAILPLIAAPATSIVQPPPLISAATFPTDSAPGMEMLWPDLEGLPQDGQIGTWIKNNLLGCSDVAPFGRVPNLRYGRFYPKPVDPNH